MDIWEILRNYYQYFLRGTQTTIIVSLITVLFGFILGCVIALMRMSKAKILSAFAKLYITVLRGTPLLVQLYIVYYQLDFITYPKISLQAVDYGQTEAARSIGMTKTQTMLHIVMPQAIKNILPAIGNEFITMIKETSIIQYLGISDLMYNNGIVVTATYNPLPCYYISAVIYLALNLITGKGLDIFERKLKRSDR